MKLFTQYCSSPLGLLQIEADENFLISLSFRDTKDAPENGNAITDVTLQQLDEYFSGERKTFEIPFQQPGTPFQQKVWNLLNAIPYSKTISYLQMAKQYGDAKAIRAIASANGKNNLAIIVPCHRVIGSNASLTGYAGGLWRKKWLLEHEAKHGAGLQQLTLL